MKPNHLFTSMLAVTALLVTSCSTPKLAQNNAIQDDVYNTTAQAKEYKPYTPAQAASADSVSNDYYGKSDPRYDMDYFSRIDRFYYGNQWRSYYDPYYNYYGYNSYYNPYGFSLGVYYGSIYNSWNNPYSNWAYYGSPYYNNYWGLYSYNNPYYGGYYGGGYYGGYYGGGYYTGRNTYNPNYGARPVRGSENGVNRANGVGYAGGSAGGAPTRGNANGDGSVLPRTRAEMYNPNNGSVGRTTNSTGNSSSDNRPTRTSTSDSRPTRTTSEAPSRPSYTPPPSSPPPSSSSSGGGRAESSGGGGGGRPTRGGR